MPKIEGFRVKNYRVIRDITLGKLWNTQNAKSLTPMTAVVDGLYHKLLETLAQEFRSHATGQKGGSQVFITTHQPYFVDALEPEEVWVLDKGEDGFSTIRRASDDPLIENLVSEGLPLGGLWYSDYLDAR